MNQQLQASPTTSPKSLVKDVVELVTPKSSRADAAGPSRSNSLDVHNHGG